jgi:hypothetical protein
MNMLKKAFTKIVRLLLLPNCPVIGYYSALKLACHWLPFGSQTGLSLADGAQTPKMSAQEASRKNIILAPVKDDLSPTLLRKKSERI